ncbi:MAG: RDD family protein [Bacteroidales bacterium]|nr:RDD family protein [Bacteroidales bacterium]
MENNQTIVQPQRIYAGFWWRFLAYLLDSIILGIVESVIIMPFLVLMGVSVFTAGQQDMNFEEAAPLLIPLFMAYFFVIIILLVVQWLYFALMESSRHQGTVGKLVIKIKVTDMNGNRITFARATGRYFAKIISGMILMIGYILAGITEKKQALHDMIAGCLVFKD